MDTQKNGKLIEALANLMRIKALMPKGMGLSQADTFMLYNIGHCARHRFMRGKEFSGEHPGPGKLSGEDVEKMDEALRRGIRISVLSDHCALSRPAVSQQIGSLEKRGLVLRTTDSGDRRAVYVGLTDLGLEKLKENIDAFLKRLSKLEEDFGEENIELLASLLERLSGLAMAQHQDQELEREANL